MDDLIDRLRGLDANPTPDVWQEVQERAPYVRPSEVDATGRQRWVTVVLAASIAMAAIAFLFLAFRPDRVETPAGNTSGKVVIGRGSVDGRNWTVSAVKDEDGVSVGFAWEGRPGGLQSVATLQGRLFGPSDVESWINPQTGAVADTEVLTGLVSSDVARLELDLRDGETLVPALFSVPPSWGEPAGVYVFFLPQSMGEPDGVMHAFDGAGNELGSEGMGSQTEPIGATPEIRAAWRNLRRARDGLADWGVHHMAGIKTLDANAASAIVPGVTFNDRSSSVVGKVSLRDVQADSFLLVSATPSGEVYCIGVEVVAGGSENFSYGIQDAVTYEDCQGGWPS